MSIKDRACVSGIGETRYLRGSPSSAVELQLEASLLAAADAGIAPHEIDGVIPIGVVSAIAEDFIENLGLTDLRFSAVIPHGGQARRRPCSRPPRWSPAGSASMC